jgi:hypothetical protein
MSVASPTGRVEVPGAGRPAAEGGPAFPPAHAPPVTPTGPSPHPILYLILSLSYLLSLSGCRISSLESLRVLAVLSLIWCGGRYLVTCHARVVVARAGSHAPVSGPSAAARRREASRAPPATAAPREQRISQGGDHYDCWAVGGPTPPFPLTSLLTHPLSAQPPSDRTLRLLCGRWVSRASGACSSATTSVW